MSYRNFQLLVLVMVAIGLGFVYIGVESQKPVNIADCPVQQHAVVVGAGKDAQGIETVLYMCENDKGSNNE